MRMLPSRPARLALALGCALALAVALGSTPVYTQGSPGLIRACVQKASTQMRLVAEGVACRPNEELVIWNIQGPTGPVGPQGPKGDTGDQGPKGDPGDLTKGTVQGRLVRCGTGGVGSIAGVAFTLVSLKGHSYTAMTNEGGEFTFHLVEPGTYEIGPPPYAGAGPVEVIAGNITTLDEYLITDTTSDVKNCGTCGVDCGLNAACVSGLCEAIACPSNTPYRCANGACVASAPSCTPAECTAPSQCAIGQNCVNKSCVQVCGSGEGLCDGVCTALNTPDRCGSCTNRCGSGMTCIGGGCLCAAGLSPCAGGCRDTRTDPAHCGACGMVCPARPNATIACLQGACGIAACTTGFANCDGAAANGCEVNVNTDARNCGACGRVCAFGQACINGACGG